MNSRCAQKSVGLDIMCANLRNKEALEAVRRAGDEAGGEDQEKK